MKSRKVKAYQAHKRAKPKPNIVLDDSDSDVHSDSFLHDDIEDFNDKKDDQLSTDDELIQHKDDSSEEEEVLPITDDEKEESDYGDDDDTGKDDNEDDQQGLPNRDAWGKRKSAYYSADFVDEDRGRTYREDDAEAARAEAEEAFAIQKSIYSNVKADNLGANLFLDEASEESSEEEEKVDIASATKQEKMKYLKTETKILEVCKEYKSAIREYQKFLTLTNIAIDKKIKSKNLENYIYTKTQILSLYCLNLSLYMVFVSSGKNPKHHPVVQRISSIKQHLDDLKPVNDIVTEITDKIYEKHMLGEEIQFCSESEVEDDINEPTIESSPKASITTLEQGKKVKKNKTKHMETENEKEVMAMMKEVKEEMKKRNKEDSDSDDEDMNECKKPKTDQDENTEEKRIISYEIAKNKGLVPHRKKEYRNPRVRHRMKFRKANIRRKGQVRGVVKEIKRYEGEATGININVVKSVKFK